MLIILTVSPKWGLVEAMMRSIPGGMVKKHYMRSKRGTAQVEIYHVLAWKRQVRISHYGACHSCLWILSISGRTG